MSQKPLSVLISGAGIAGSSLALMLSRHPSLEPKPIVTLVERSTTPRTTGQAIDIRGPGVGVIRKLDLEEKIKARHTTEVGISMIDAKGKQIARFDATGDGSNQSATSEYEILRGDLAALLMEEVDAARKSLSANVQEVYGEHIQSLSQHEDGVAVEFTNGKLEAQKFDVVIAADGMASSTRSLMFREYRSQDCIKPMGMYIAYFSVPRLEVDEDLWKWCTVPDGLAVHMRPHRNKKTMGIYLSLVMPKKERSPEIDDALAKGVAAQKAMLHDRFNGVGWQIKRLLDGMHEANDFYMQHVAQVITPK